MEWGIAHFEGKLLSDMTKEELIEVIQKMHRQRMEAINRHDRELREARLGPRPRGNMDMMG